MPTPVFADGTRNGVSFTPTGGAEVAIRIQGWDHSEEVDDVDTTHSGSLGIQEVIATILRANGTVSGTYDLANQLHKDPGGGITAGRKGVIKVYVSLSLYFQVPVLIKSVPYKSTVPGKVDFAFTYKLSGDAGTYLRPA
jgi:hypothetical protein